ncbi:hypothetical protein JTB14_037959 [Gonioctena quinquepunctata]|nr:hypothetical protein JTB14_037959 [Gonioctena quinquepunctata]
MCEIKVETDGKIKYKEYFPTSGLVKFKVRASHDAGILLSSIAAYEQRNYEVFFGQKGNTVSYIYKDRAESAWWTRRIF